MSSPSSNTTNSDDLLLRTMMGRLYVYDNELNEEKEPDPTMSWVAKEEWEVYREILKLIHSRKIDLLKPNCRNGTTIRGHCICVTMYEPKDSNCREWEWHGLVGTYDPQFGYTHEHIHGCYTERLLTKKLHDAFDVRLENVEGLEISRVRMMRDSIDGKDVSGDDSSSKH